MPDFLTNHKIAGRLAFLWALTLVTLIVGHYLASPLGTANMADATIIGAIVGLPTAAIAFLQWQQGRDP